MHTICSFSFSESLTMAAPDPKSQKHGDFIRRYARDRPIISIPGIGQVFGEILANCNENEGRGYNTVGDVEDRFKNVMTNDLEIEVQGWLARLCPNANKKHMSDFYAAIFDLCERSPGCEPRQRL